ncbi:hypothetical protein [Polaribacter sp.]|uniref:hypothetical protein n=1 Tax=Polaribacter sp. TaxID=1920175 RepID=UPI003F6C47A3
MGENKHIKELDTFAKKYVKEIPKAEPSIDFTSNLMQKISLEANIQTLKTTSLISKKGWFAIVAMVVVTLFLAFKNTGESPFSFPEIKLNFLNQFNEFNVVKSISLSNTTVYAFVFFGLMIGIQFTYLKKYFDKRMS